ncbi:MAG: hypothetical protein IJS54_03865 [Desulfovibrio sp.]|nr:hypothetical protein [Desulfovibrio sp.]
MQRIVVLVLLMLCCSVQTSFGARLLLREQSTFVGEIVSKSYRETVRLTLLDGHYFVLRQEFSSGSRHFTRDTTGHWRQREGGESLTLSNRYGFFLRLSVGMENLYGRVHSVASEHRDLVSLRPVAFTQPHFTVMGLLSRSSKSASFDSLLDAASGRAFHVGGEALKQLPTVPLLFVDAELHLGLQGCEISRIRSFSQTIPKQTQPKQRKSFAKLVKDKTFWLVLGKKTLSAVFTLADGGRGTLTFSAPGLWLSLPFRWSETELVFTLTKKNKTLLHLCDADKLLSLLESTTSWNWDASALVLMDHDNELALLEDAAYMPVSREGSLGGRSFR